MTQDEKLYVELTYKSIHVPLTDEETGDIERIQKEFGIKPCPQCEGEGGRDLPSMLGYGWEWCTCTLCKGPGEVNLTPYLKEELIKIHVR